ncbi:class I SAM-dependent methyltransferase [Bacillus sp. FSL R5-0677]|uniref:class I SAM-dependent methyltransferase n=1 Tax=Bacillus sp. FSL R5-0677 TaxID=2921581 RepID=UPI000BF44B72|nr:hypothetical protein COJ45_18800 [Bacillus cereus]
MKNNDIKGFWENRALKHKTSPAASWEDITFIQRENRILLKLIPSDSKNILDMGCANGYTSFFLASKNINFCVEGIDFSKEMINYANKTRGNLTDELQSRLSFKEADIRSSPLKENYYDAIISKRVLINLIKNSEKELAIENMHKSLKDGGYLILSEATKDGLKEINILRERFKLERLKEPWHNDYLCEEWIEKVIKEKFELIKVVQFSGTYYLGTRVIYPLLIKNLKFNTNYHKILSRLPSLPKYSLQKVFVLKKI